MDTQIHVANATNNKNTVSTTANGSSVGHVQVGRNLNMNANQALSLQETYDTFSVNPFSSVPQSAFQQGGTAYIDFQLPTTCGILRNVEAVLTVMNTGSNAHTWACPVMPFAINHVELWQNGAKVGLDIPSTALWKHIGYTDTLNELILQQSRSTIDHNTFNVDASNNTIGAGASKVYSFDIGRLMQIVQGQICVKWLKQLTVRCYIENINLLCPGSINTTNPNIIVSNMTLTCTQLLLSSGAEGRLAADYKAGSIDARCLQVKEEKATVVAVAGTSVQYNTNAFNNDVVALLDCGFRGGNATGADYVNFQPVNKLYLTTQDGINLHNGLQPTNDDWNSIWFPKAFPDCIFPLAPLKNILPVITGSTNCRESLRKAKQLGFKTAFNRFIVNIDMTSGNYQILLHGWIYSHARVSPAGDLTIY